MQLSRMSSGLGTVAAVALALAVYGWAAPAARASCGDYVTMPGQHHEPGETQVTQPAAHTIRHALSHNRQPTAIPIPCGCPSRPEAPPCRGPWCSGHPQPAPAPTSTVEKPHETWAICSMIGRLDRTHSIAARPVATTDRGCPFVLRIYHPPRAA